MAPKVQSANATAILELRKQIKNLANEEGAEALFETIQNDSAISSADKQRLHVELQTRVNEVQQVEIDKKVAAKDQKGADKILNRAEEEQVDEKGKKLPSARKPLRTAEEIEEENAEIELKPAHVPEGCKSVQMTAKDAQDYEANDMTLPSKDRKLMGMKPITDGRRDTPITKFLVIVKIALFMALILIPGRVFAASDDIVDLSGFDQTTGFKVDASGDLVPVTTNVNDIGESAKIIKTIYAGIISAVTQTITTLTATTVISAQIDAQSPTVVSQYSRIFPMYLQMYVWSASLRPASGLTAGRVVMINNATNSGDCGTAGGGSTFVVCASDGTLWKSLTFKPN